MNMMTVLASLKEEKRAGGLSGGSMVMGTAGLEEAVPAFGLPGLRKMMVTWL